MELRRLTSRGLELFREFLKVLLNNAAADVPTNLLADERFSEAVAPRTEYCPETFSDRMHLAAYLDRLLAPLPVTSVQADEGLWSWLALAFFDQLCPAGSDGTRKPGSLGRWIPQLDESRRYYRHLLLGPYMLYQAHRDGPERATALFCNPVDVATPEVFRLFIENPDLARSRTAVAVATHLYYNPRTRRTKRGTGRKESGGCRRLIQILRQFDCTYDLETLSPATLCEMLPKEFADFK